MLLGRVVGTLVASRKDDRLVGSTLLLVRELGIDGQERGGHVVAVDAVGAGTGEVVLYASGSSARQTTMTENRPVDAVIMAIVDSWEVGGVDVFRKDATPDIVTRSASPPAAQQATAKTASKASKSNTVRKAGGSSTAAAATKRRARGKSG